MKSTKLYLAVALLLCAFQAVAADFVAGGISYRTVDGGVAVIKQANGYSGSINIPGQVTNGGVAYQVVAVADSAFLNCTEVTAVQMPESLTSVGKYAFMNTGIARITIPFNVTAMGNKAFNDCSKLELVNYNARNCEGVANYVAAWFRNSPVKEMIFGEGVDSIPRYMIYECPTVQSVTISSSVKYISSSAFLYASGLTRLVFNSNQCVPPGSDGSAWFRQCPLTTVELGPNVTALPDYFLCGQTVLKAFTFPSTVQSIGKYAFRNCQALETVTIPEQITSIGSQAFADCPALRTVNFNARRCAGATSKYNVWFRNDSILTFNIGNAVEVLPDYFFYNQKAVTRMSLPDAVEEIGEHSYEGTGLQTLTIPERIKSIGAEAFANCPDLMTVNYNAIDCKGVSSTSDAWFNGDSITTINIGPEVLSLPYAFAYKQAITSIVIPESITSIDHYAFRKCMYLKKVNFNARRCVMNTTSRLYAPFYEIPVEEFAFGPEVEYVPDYLACNMDNLTLIDWPDNLTKIGKESFYNCTGLTNLKLPSRIQEISDRAFAGCSGLTGEMVVPASIVYIGSSAFSGTGFHRTIATAMVAPTLSKTAFSWDQRYHCWLIVPRLTAQSYANTNGWSSFSFMMNDVTGDDKIDIADLNAIINLVLGIGVTDELIKAGDVTGDGKVDVKDINNAITYLLDN